MAIEPFQSKSVPLKLGYSRCTTDIVFLQQLPFVTVSRLWHHTFLLFSYLLKLMGEPVSSVSHAAQDFGILNKGHVTNSCSQPPPGRGAIFLRKIGIMASVT